MIENDFGTVGIDGGLINVATNALFELNDGCICCSVRDDLIEALNQIAAQNGDLDHILTETTGLADP